MSKIAKKIIDGLNSYIISLKQDKGMQFDAELSIKQGMMIIKEKENIKIFPLKRRKKHES